MRDEDIGKVITARGPIYPSELGAVLMHEHLHSDWRQMSESPTRAENLRVLEDEAVPDMRRLHDYGCNAYVDHTFAPNRAEPWIYRRISAQAGLHIICATGYYREIEVGTYWVKKEADAIWPFVRNEPVEVLEELCVREVEEGKLIAKWHGTWEEMQKSSEGREDAGVRAGFIKLGASGSELTPLERKAFTAGARAQQRTGVYVSTHCTDRLGHRDQVDSLVSNGVNPERIVIGHTMSAILGDWPEVRARMKRGVTYAPTNLRIDREDEVIRQWVDAIRKVFDEGFGDRLCISLDATIASGYHDGEGRTGDTNYTFAHAVIPKPYLVYLFTHTLPRFRELGLEDRAIEQMLLENPRRILPVRKP